jgi:hypothetical protein
MRDLDSGEELTFSCRRWLARDEDDQEITRELAVKRPGDPILPCMSKCLLFIGISERNTYKVV